MIIYVWDAAKYGTGIGGDEGIRFESTGVPVPDDLIVMRRASILNVL